jgi:Sulfotransferase domain
LAWVQAHERAQLLMQRHPERVLTIRYEDFLAEQATVLKKVCEFFGMQFLPEMLDVSRSSEAQQISRMSALWESNCFPPIAANKDKFKSQLAVEEIEAIETLTQDWMRRYGYELITPAAAPALNDEALAACRARSDAARVAAWAALAERDYQDFALRRFRADYLARVRERLLNG